MRHDTGRHKMAILWCILIDGETSAHGAYPNEFRLWERARTKVQEPLAHLTVGCGTRGAVVKSQKRPDINKKSRNSPFHENVKNCEVHWHSSGNSFGLNWGEIW
jgi:hypothetical protein